MCVCVVCVCVLFVDLFQDDLRCLFRPHQVNHGGVQKSPIIRGSPDPSTFLSRIRFCSTLAHFARSVSWGLKKFQKNKKESNFLVVTQRDRGVVAHILRKSCLSLCV